jgi:hypothetical protein
MYTLGSGSHLSELGTSVSIKAKLEAGRPWFNSPQGQLCPFLSATASRFALGPTQPPIQWVPGAVIPEVKQPGLEADHSLPFSAKVKNAWNYTPIPQYVFMAWCLVKHRDYINFAFTTLAPMVQTQIYCFKAYHTIYNTVRS